MTARPIIFSAPMVRALWDGRKTQTRRVLKPLPRRTIFFNAKTAGLDQFQEPPYAPGDRLYVREAHALVPSTAYRFSPGVPYAVNAEDRYQACVYREGWERSKPGTGWRPSIHMPRWASRLTLTVTEVRVQRLQEISEADAVAEGAEIAQGIHGLDGGCMVKTEVPYITATPYRWYRDLWNSLHGPDAWDANPWVVAVSFTVDRRNIDHL